ncbi:MAG TPA: glycosyltransferase 87 family protein [Candidatus Limnocylindrales bacterium]|nr:glycosyltransferase 87 family protein [Candidatus Limnocylindrales bacterium]
MTERLAAPVAALDALRARIGRRRMRTLDIGLRAGFVVALVIFAIYRPMAAADAHAYWAVNIADPYTRPIATTDAFTYPPPAALAFSVLGHLPWEVFQALWTILIGLALLWLVGPWSILFLAIPIVSSDLYLGNIHILLAAAIVAAFRWPALWAFALLTKPTCGVGLLWFAVRGEWRRLAIAVGTTGAIVVASAIIAPGLWPAWIDYVLQTGVAPNVGTAAWVPIPLLIRLPIATVVVVWGARTDRPWTVPIASMLALPVLWMVGLSMIVGALAVARRPSKRRAATLGARSQPERAVA